MKTLAYILSDRKIKGVLECIEVVNSIDLVDHSKPLLIVGYEQAKAYCGKDFNILEHKISDNVFWTFKKTEKRNMYEEDLINFYNYIIHSLIESVTYNNVCIFYLRYSHAKMLLEKIRNGNTIFYYSNKTLYMLYNNTNVYGFSMNEFNYLGIKYNKLYELITSNKTNKIITNYSYFPYNIKRMILNYNYIVPYIEYLSE